MTDILNQQNSTHLTVTHATISEHDDSTATLSAPTTLVALASILLLVAPALTGDGGGGEMRIPKRPVRVQLAVPPVRVTGTIHVPPGSLPTDGLLNMSDRYIAVTGQQDHRTADEPNRAVDDAGHGERAAPHGPCLFLVVRQGGDACHGIRPWQP